MCQVHHVHVSFMDHVIKLILQDSLLVLTNFKSLDFVSILSLTLPNISLQNIFSHASCIRCFTPTFLAKLIY